MSDDTYDVRSVEIEEDSHCASIFVVRFGYLKDKLTKWAIEERVRAWAITGGTMALSLEDHSMSERFNYCEERDDNIHDYTQWNGVSPLHYDGNFETIYAYTLRVIEQRRVQREREEIIGPPRFSPVFFDVANQCEFTLHWGDNVTTESLLTRDIHQWEYEQCGYVSPIRASSDYYSVPGMDVINYCDDSWKAAIYAYETSCDGMNSKRFYELTSTQFRKYLEMVSHLNGYPTHPVKVFDS